MPKTFSTNDLPIRVDLFHDEATVLTGNALGSATVDTGQAYNYYIRQSTSADADSFTQSVFLRAGTYTFSVIGQTNTANGKIDWYIDNVSFTTGQDWYSASQTKNVVKTASVTINSDGYHVLKGVINTKNASSSGFNMDLTKYWFRTSAD